ncbi:MAG: cyclic pyranopterin monophosphate synthase MoaC [Myxococcales bacterium]|nr:cyclic pyranopterin monophosphate synthase MoaC [Myxococcales bacterium]MCB9643368.1 cyclic pyranopterin monophosphate synthase MoaC [Myxococcales bacterium]
MSQETNPTQLTHLDEEGAARMVDISEKAVTSRRAVAQAFVRMLPETLDLLMHAKLPKGDALQVARIAGIMGAKRTWELIPLCHPIPLSKIEIHIEAIDDTTVRVSADVRNAAQTGVEMEALTACSLAALTLYDMAKAVDPAMMITDIGLVEKSGGKRGDWKAPQTTP